MKIYQSLNLTYYFDLEDKILIVRVSNYTTTPSKNHVSFDLVENAKRISSLRELIFNVLYKEIVPEVLLTSSNSILRKILREDSYLNEIILDSKATKKDFDKRYQEEKMLIYKTFRES